MSLAGLLAQRSLRWAVGRYYGLQRRLALRRVRRLSAGAGPHHSQPLIIPPQDVQRVLIVNTGLIGDTVMCTPAMAETRRIFSSARITGLVTAHVRSLLEPSGYVDDWLLYEHSPFPQHPGKRAAYRSLIDRVRAARFDVALILLGDDFAGLLAEAGIPYRIGVDGDELAGCCTHTYAIGSPRTWGPNERLGAWLGHKSQRGHDGSR